MADQSLQPATEWVPERWRAARLSETSRVGAIGILIGTVAWMLWAAGPARINQTGLVFFIVEVLAAIILGGLFPKAVGIIGPSLVAVPVILVVPTVDRGDGDGLFLFWVPYMLVFGGVLLIASLVAKSTIGRLPTLAEIRTPGPRIALLALVLSLAAAIVLWPNPYRELDRMLDDFPIPAGFKVVETRREGDPMCSKSCGAVSIKEMTVDTHDLAACQEISAAVREWIGKSLTGCYARIQMEGGPTGIITVLVSVQHDYEPNEPFPFEPRSIAHIAVKVGTY